MNPRSEVLNGRHPDESKGTIEDAFKASQIAEQAKSETSNIRMQAGNYLEVTAEYAKRHPWRIAITAASIGVIAGAFFAMSKTFDKRRGIG